MPRDPPVTATTFPVLDTRSSWPRYPNRPNRATQNSEAASSSNAVSVTDWLSLLRGGRVTLARAQGGQCSVVLNADKRLVGTLTMSLPPSKGLQELTKAARVPDRAWLNQVAVSPSEQRAGIASELWSLGLEWVRQQGATSIGVDTAVPAEHLVQLYSSWGFGRALTTALSLK